MKIKLPAGKFFILWQDSKFSTAVNRIGQQKRRRLLAPGRWKMREAGDEAVDENKLPQKGRIR
jgi:hypothetical protein